MPAPAGYPITRRIAFGKIGVHRAPFGKIARQRPPLQPVRNTYSTACLFQQWTNQLKLGAAGVAGITYSAHSSKRSDIL